MGTSPIFTDGWRSGVRTIATGHSTRPVVAAVAGADGSRVHALNVRSNDTADNIINTYLCTPMTLQSAMGTGAFVDGGGSSDTITRISGSFVTDGWKVGDALIVAGATTLANDFLVNLTAVAATTLTFATATVAAAENMPTGSILYKAVKLGTDAVPTDAGNVSTVPSVDLFNGNISCILDAPNGFLTLGPLEALAMRMGTALGAGEYIDIYTGIGDY